MTESSFMVLQMIGALSWEAGSEVRFSIDAYRGYRYASIRKYFTEGDYIGASRVGITLTPEIVQTLNPLIQKLPDTPSQIPDQQVGKFAKRPGLSIIATISTFRGARGLDLRQWQEDERYKGWTKKGLRLPLEKIKEIKALFAQLAAALSEKPQEV